MQCNAMPMKGGLLKTADNFLQAHCPAGDFGNSLLRFHFTLSFNSFVAFCFEEKIFYKNEKKVLLQNTWCWYWFYIDSMLILMLILSLCWYWFYADTDSMLMLMLILSLCWYWFHADADIMLMVICRRSKRVSPYEHHLSARISAGRQIRGSLTH